MGGGLMPRRTINNEGDAAKLLADCMMKLVRCRGENLNGNDLHALVGACESYTYMQEVHRVIQTRERTLRATGLDPVDIDIQRHAVMNRLKRHIEHETGERIIIPAKPARKATAKPQAFRTTERNIAENARINTGLPTGKSKKRRVRLTPAPRTARR